MEPLKIQLTVDDIIAAQRLHARAEGIKVIATVSAVVIVCTVFFFPKGSLTEWLTLLGVGAIMVAVLWVLALFSRVLAIPLRAGRTYRTQKDLQRPFQLSWDAENVLTASANGNSTIPWKDFLKWREGKRLFLLYRSDRLFQLFPKRAFRDEAQTSEFAAMMRRYISPTAGRRRKD